MISQGSEIQLSFIPEGWFQMDTSKNRLLVFLRNYPFEEKFEEIRKQFENYRYIERKKAALLRKQQADKEALHFDFYDGLEVADELVVKTRESNAGRKPFDFYGLLKLFFACLLKNVTQVTEVYEELHDNVVLQWECFPEGKLPSYDVPASFDRDMNKWNLMKEIRKIAVETNFAEKVNEFDGRLIVDVTHSEGNGKVARMTKACRDCHRVQANSSCERCVNGQPCDTPELTDETIDIVHKNKGKVMKAHKYQIASTSLELPIGVVAFNGRKSDGGESFEQILQEIKHDFEALIDHCQQSLEVYVDGIYNTEANCKMVQDVLGPGAALKSKPNPGNRKSHTIKRKGINFTVDKRANVKCEKDARFSFDAREIDQDRYRFSVDNKEQCLTCSLHDQCCPEAKQGRTLRIDKKFLSHYNWEDPEFTKSYAKKYNIRTGIERIIGRGKDLLGFRRQFKRGIRNVQGFGDRLIAMINMIAYVAHAIGHPERMLQCRNFAFG